MTRPAPRVVEALNAALHRLFEERTSLHLLGEDVRDPYGGAFKVTRGLSARHPDRVLSTPISEAGITGVAGGLALAGDQAIVEMMFGDFAALAFDQILNLISKSVTMYGDRVPMPVVVRCPVGGNRGYGPTHSQSLQKHFLGVPNLALYETSPFHDPYAQLAEGLDRGPAMLFEDKVLYTRRMFRDGVVDEHHRYALRGGPTGWAHISSMDGTAADVVLICPGGTAHRALDAARLLRARGSPRTSWSRPGSTRPTWSRCCRCWRTPAWSPWRRRAPRAVPGAPRSPPGCTRGSGRNCARPSCC